MKDLPLTPTEIRWLIPTGEERNIGRFDTQAYDCDRMV